MSTVSDLDLNLDNLFQPAWAQGKTESNKFAKFTGNEGVKPERQFSGKPGERRAPRRDAGGGGERRGGFGGPPRAGPPRRSPPPPPNPPPARGVRRSPGLLLYWRSGLTPSLPVNLANLLDSVFPCAHAG